MDAVTVKEETMADTTDVSGRQDEDLNPSMSQAPTNNQTEPGTTNQDMPVPEDEKNAGHDTNLPRTFDSPESLDQELSEGANREDIDPDHSMPRPEGVDSIDKEENGAD
jgi:hypothetical protein